MTYTMYMSRTIYSEGATVEVQLAELRAEVAKLHEKLDELLADSRRARPMLDKYLNSPVAGWMLGKKANRG